MQQRLPASYLYHAKGDNNNKSLLLAKTKVRAAHIRLPSLLFRLTLRDVTWVLVTWSLAVGCTGRKIWLPHTSFLCKIRVCWKVVVVVEVEVRRWRDKCLITLHLSFILLSSELTKGIKGRFSEIINDRIKKIFIIFLRTQLPFKIKEVQNIVVGGEGITTTLTTRLL